MAIMHPPSLDNYDATESEKIFFKELKSQLDDSYHVFYSVKWYGTDENGLRNNSECDFLIFTSNFGYLTIELKGGTRIEVNDRHWTLYYKDKDGDMDYRDLGRGPYKQAERSMYYFYNYYKTETSSRFQGVYGMAVAFPFYNIDVTLENDAPRELTIQHSDMKCLKQRINALFHYWNTNNGGTFLPDSQAKKFIGLVNKRVALSVAAGALIPITQRKIGTINIVQDAIISVLTNYKRIRIVGGAGTGKTWIAIKKIRQQVMIGKQCLFTCFSSKLCDYVKKQIDNMLVDCIDVETLFKDTVKNRCDATITRDENGDAEYYDILCGMNNKKYDCVIIDEAQDFTEDWAKSINLYTKPDGLFWVLYDENQNIYGRNFRKGFNIDTEPYILTHNIRNTRNIHTWIKEKTKFGEQIISNDVCGCDPEIHNFNNINQVSVYLNHIFNQLITGENVSPSSVVVLVNGYKTDVWEKKQFGKYSLRNDVEEANHIKLSSVEDYKGLEASIVIYLNGWPEGVCKTEEYYNALYVAGTRAKYYLYVINYSDL